MRTVLDALLAAGVAPPGAAKFTMIVGWVTWGATALCGLAFVILGTRLAISIRRGETGEHASQLGAAMAGVVIVGVASQIVNALIA